jgi:PPOX class probable F420-dependent enzyme
VRLSPDRSRELFAAARVARLATADGAGVPHLVPVTFVVESLRDGGQDTDVVWFAVDHKPKSGTNLRRLRNIAANPLVSFLADCYDEDWSRLWWVRADGVADVLRAPEQRREPVALLREKYPQYDRTPPDGAVVRTRVTRWSGWSAS